MSKKVDKMIFCQGLKKRILIESMVRYMKSFEHDQLMYEEGRLAEIENTERENSLYVKMVS